MGGGKNNLEIASSKKKCLMSGILGIAIGGIIFGGIGVAAVTLSADKITYSPSNSEFRVDNAKDALDNLYDMANDASTLGELVAVENTETLVGETQYVSVSVDNLTVGEEYSVILTLLDYSLQSVYLDNGVGYEEISSEKILSAYAANKGVNNRSIYLLKIRPTDSTVTFNMHSGTEYSAKYNKSFTAIVYK